MTRLANFLTMDLGRVSGDLYSAMNVSGVVKSQRVIYGFIGENTVSTQFGFPSGNVHMNQVFHRNGADLLRLRIQAVHDVYEEPRDGLRCFDMRQTQIIEINPQDGLFVARTTQLATGSIKKQKASLNAAEAGREHLVDHQAWEIPSLMFFEEMCDAMRDPSCPLFKGKITRTSLPAWA